MKVDEAVNYIHSLRHTGKKRGLSQIQRLLELLDNPQKKLKFIHVGGTNGKGSTCAMLAEVLKNEGYKVGLFTSPYIMRFAERIRVSDVSARSEEIGVLPGFVEISDGDLSEITAQVKEKIEQMEEPPSEFEVVTVIGFLYFLKQNCDYVVLEVGMGGEFDATNVINCPLVTVLTNIGIDHTMYLGDSVEEITGTKSKIIKPGTRAVYYGNDIDALAVIEKRCKETGVELTMPDFKQIKKIESTYSGQVFTYKNLTIRLSVIGEYQKKNAALVVETVEALRKAGVAVSDDSVLKGLSETVWLGRLERLSDKPYVFVDGSHNPQGMQATVDSLKEVFDFDSIFAPKIVCVLGVMQDKQYKEMIEILSEVASEIITVEPKYPRAVSSAQLCNEANAVLRTKNVAVIEGGSVIDGIKLGLSRCNDYDILLCLGSLYLVAEARDYLIRELPLSKLRLEIDAVDNQIIELFEKRQIIAENIGNVKKQSGMKVFDQAREALKLDAVEKKVTDPKNAKAVRELFQVLMDLSKNRQNGK